MTIMARVFLVSDTSSGGSHKNARFMQRTDRIAPIAMASHLDNDDGCV